MLGILGVFDGTGCRMLTWVENSWPPLEQATLRVLREHAGENHSALPPFRLPRVAEQIVTAVAQFLRDGDSAAAQAFGEQLGTQGLGLRSWLAVGRALTRELVARACGPEASSGAVKDGPTVLARLDEFMSHVVEGLTRHDLAALSHERDEINKALERVIQAREDELRLVIEQLSTPVMPVHRRILVLPLIGRINEERARRITERLLSETTQRQARIVIIDVTGLSTSDAGAISALTGTMRAVQLLGARAVLVGMPPEMARTLVELAVELAGLSVLADLQSGVEWALHELGLAILPQPSRPSPKRRKSDKWSTHHGD